jgi:hypothetical protein
MGPVTDLRRFQACCAGLAAAALALAACTSVPQASPERDAEVKQFLTHPNAAALYIYRPDFPSGEIEWTDSVLWVDDRLIGSTLPRTYFRLDLRQGKHVLRGDGPDLGRLALDTGTGEIYFVRLNVIGSTSHFALVPPETGKMEVLRCCVLMENWAPGQRPLLR